MGARLRLFLSQGQAVHLAPGASGFTSYPDAQAALRDLSAIEPFAWVRRPLEKATKFSASDAFRFLGLTLFLIQL